METNKDSRLKICWMRIVGFQQFQDVFLDFTHPDTGEPLDKICFIGANGTGKTVLLETIDRMLWSLGKNTSNTGPKHWIILRLFSNGEHFLFGQGSDGFFLHPWSAEYADFREMPIEEVQSVLSLTKQSSSPSYIEPLTGNAESGDLQVYSPSDSPTNQTIEIPDVPKTTLAEAVKLIEEFGSRQIVSNETINQFWKTLLMRCHLRREEQQGFELLPENLERTKRELIEEFNTKHPEILHEVGKLWNRILDKAGLEFDSANAKVPFQPMDNLRAYIVLKDKKSAIRYQSLSSGIRNYIFRVGHIFSLFFLRKNRRAFLLIDEPENGLFPDFLYDLVTVYQEAIGEISVDQGTARTQMFFATHEPIIAAQFEPYERVILEWNDDGTVRSRRGTSPIGDDPNDLLKQDFGVAHLMGKEGLAQWNEYLRLRRELRNTDNSDQKLDLVGRILSIGRQYNFGTNEISSQNA